MYTAATTVRVRYAETDKMNVVYHGNFAQYFEVGRVEAMRALGYSYKEMEADGVIMPVVELNCKFVRPALYDDLLTIKTLLKELPTDYKITFSQEVYNEHGKLLAFAQVVLYFMDATSMTKTTMPARLANELETFFNV